jgi:hypothetical protein
MVLVVQAKKSLASKTGSVPGILRSFGSRGHATRDGPPDLSKSACASVSNI